MSDAVSEIAGALRSRLGAYPGRVLVVGRTSTGASRWAYLLTGRSRASRSRRFRRLDDALVVETADDSIGHDPLRHYTCASTVAADGPLVIGNGDHATHIVSVLRRGGTPADAAAGMEPEPDPPIHTPRIAFVVGDVQVVGVAVRRAPDGRVDRQAVDAVPAPGEITVLHTYSGDVAGPKGTGPSFRFAVPDDVDVAELLWLAADPAVRAMSCGGSGHDPVPTRWVPNAALRPASGG